MSRTRKRKVAPETPTSPSEGTNASPRPSREAIVLSLAAAAICLFLTWLSRSALNPDGVSYLDLTGQLLDGNWHAFVQGYWSPLYPALVAALGSITDRDPRTLIATAHIINGAATLAAIGLLWWWSRRSTDSFFARTAIATLLLVSAGLPRIEAITPDTLLLALTTWLGYELLVHRGARWWLVGAILGTIFLVKTSAWPWLLLALPLRFWGATTPEQRKNLLRSSALCAAVMLLWIIPMSMKAGHVTVGSAGRLNYCWYLEACDSRTPDTHLGDHTSYHKVAVDSVHTLTWASFAEEGWTYAPWSDPTAWEAGVTSKTSHTPTLIDLIAYWGRQAKNSLGLWLLPVLIGVLLPSFLLRRRAGMWRELVDERREVLVVSALGLAGVAQFVLIHSEPRLIAPFGMLFALGILHWLWHDGSQALRVSPAVMHLATVLGLFGVIGFAFPRLQEGLESSARIATVFDAVSRTNGQLASAGLSQRRIVILGPAIPVEASAYLSGSRIVAQLPPASVEVLQQLPGDQQAETVTRIFTGMADIAWLTTADAGVTFLVIPKPGAK